MNVDLTQLKPVADALSDPIEDSAMLATMASEAKAFLESFDWCDGVTQQYFGLGVGGVVAVFLCQLRHANPDVDDWLWVVVGDIPSAYIVTDDAPTSAAALETYIELMSEWVAAAKNGSDVQHLIPVNVPATPEWGRNLETRLAFIQGNILNGDS